MPRMSLLPPWRFTATIGLIGSLVSACHTASEHSVVMTENHVRSGQDQPGIHGMLVVGDGPVYLSQVSLLHKSQDYQVLLEVDLLRASDDPVAIYVQDRKTTGEKIYTLLPEPMVLSELFTPQGAPTRRTFKASLFRGHFEHGGQEFLSDLTVRVKRVIMGRKIARNPADSPDLLYVVFGNDQQLFAAHLINKRPDFEHVVAVRLTSGVMNSEQARTIERGTLLNISNMANSASCALKAGDEVTADARIGEELLPISLQTLTDYYMETDALSL